MPVFKAENARVVARTATMDARDEYTKHARRLRDARKKKGGEQVVPAMESYVDYLRAEWQHKRVLEQVKVTAVSLARAKLAEEKKLSGYGTVAGWKQRMKAARKNAEDARKGVDLVLARSRVPDAWAMSKKTSHNRQSRLVQAIEFFERMSQVIAKAKSNCRIMARELNRLFLKRTRIVERLREGGDAPFAEIHKKGNKFRTRADAATKNMLAGVAACIRNVRVKRLLERLSPRRH